MLDKKWGKDITDDGMEEALLRFFHNGTKLRVQLLELFLDKLKELWVFMDSQQHFRFYSSSLLFLYDGIEEQSSYPR